MPYEHTPSHLYASGGRLARAMRVLVEASEVDELLSDAASRASVYLARQRAAEELAHIVQGTSSEGRDVLAMAIDYCTPVPTPEPPEGRF